MTTRPSKKRGRKPKGGKLIDAPVPESSQTGLSPPVILHLHCRLSDLEQLDLSARSPIPYEGVLEDTAEPCLVHQEGTSGASAGITIDERLTDLSRAMQQNDVSDRNSSCFWCTYPFDNPPVYIPRARTARSLKGYGCFCSPECAAAYLFNQKNLDKSTMHERHCLLNNVYGKTYGYHKPIKAAPDPHFLLQRFCGTLSIEEYRASLASDRVVLVVNEPLSRTLPEIHVHSNGLGNAPPSGGGYRLARRDRPKTKTQRLNQAFGV